MSNTNGVHQHSIAWVLGAKDVPKVKCSNDVDWH
jgi:hypothetical protein